MHRVELKVINIGKPYKTLYIKPFLMHRVELKEAHVQKGFQNPVLVPNAPCGVESSVCILVPSYAVFIVPNAPCGVESVELKD